MGCEWRLAHWREWPLLQNDWYHPKCRGDEEDSHGRAETQVTQLQTNGHQGLLKTAEVEDTKEGLSRTRLSRARLYLKFELLTTAMERQCFSIA